MAGTTAARRGGGVTCKVSQKKLMTNQRKLNQCKLLFIFLIYLSSFNFFLLVHGLINLISLLDKIIYIY